MGKPSFLVKNIEHLQKVLKGKDYIKFMTIVTLVEFHFGMYSIHQLPLSEFTSIATGSPGLGSECAKCQLLEKRSAEQQCLSCNRGFKLNQVGWPDGRVDGDDGLLKAVLETSHVHLRILTSKHSDTVKMN